MVALSALSLAFGLGGWAFIFSGRPLTGTRLCAVGVVLSLPGLCKLL